MTISNMLDNNINYAIFKFQVVDEKCCNIKENKSSAGSVALLIRRIVG